MGNWTAALQAASVDAKLGKVDQVALLKALGSYELVLEASTENERELVDALTLAVKAPGVAAGASR